MEARVKCDGCDVDISVTSESLEWLPRPDVNTRKRVVNIESIIAVSKDGDADSFSVHWAESAADGRLSAQTAIFTCDGAEQCDVMTTTIRTHMQDVLKDRPRHLLVIINPQAGKKNAQQMYTEFAAPLFQLAGVTTDVIVTERKKHAEELLQEYDLSDVDGVISVGGDGTLKECISGLILRDLKNKGCNSLKRETQLLQLDMRVAALPGGSGNVIASLTSKTKDFTTVCLHIILGHRCESLDVAPVFSGDTFLCFSIITVILGFCNDVMFEAESSRRFQFLGQKRYFVFLAKKMFSRTPIQLEVEYSDCRNEEGTDVDRSSVRRHTVSGQFVDLNLAQMCFHGQAIGLHRAPGRWHLYLMKECSKWMHFQFYWRAYVAGQDVEPEMMDRMVYIETDDVTIRITGGGVLQQVQVPSGAGNSETSREERYVTNVDGDNVVMPQPEITARLYKRIIPFFGAELK